MPRHHTAARLVRAADRRARSSRGTTAVEFAIVVPLLLLILLGIIDFGRLLFVQVSLNAASREGARAASLYSPTSAQQSSVITRVTDVVQRPLKAWDALRPILETQWFVEKAKEQAEAKIGRASCRERVLDHV